MNATKLKISQEFSLPAHAARPLPPAGGGIWKITLPVSLGTHHDRFLVDGEWQDDPQCAIRVPNPFGTQNNVRVATAHST